MKRRRYRERKKQKLKSSFHCDKPYKVDIDKAICIYKEGHEETGCHCHTLEIEESEPDNRWQTFEKEKEEMREKDKCIEKTLEDAYGEYVDLEPSFPPCHELSTVQLPSYLHVMDRVSIKAKMLELKAACENAKEIASHYRDRCSELKIQLQEQQAKTLHVYSQGLRDKQKVRQFWRNEILEEKSRSGKILKSALVKKVHE